MMEENEENWVTRLIDNAKKELEKLPKSIVYPKRINENEKLKSQRS